MSESNQEIGDKDDKFPVLRITAAEAAVVAEWLGGRLPKFSQWDAAAGLDGDDLRPFELNISEVARGLQSSGPVEVGSRPKDEVHGMFDVGGNGREWTRDFTDFGGATIHDANLFRRHEPKGFPKDVEIWLRSFSYLDPRTAEEIRPVVLQRKKFGILPWTMADEQTSFRVVLEP